MAFLLAATTALHLSEPPPVGRRAVVGMIPLIPFLATPLPSRAAVGGVPEGMRTSESYTNLQQISPETTGTLGAGTMSSRSRPVTGVVLLEQVAHASYVAHRAGDRVTTEPVRGVCLVRC